MLLDAGQPRRRRRGDRQGAGPPEGLRYFGIDVPEPPRAEDRPIPFTPLPEVEKAIRRSLAALDLAGAASRSVEDATNRARGRV